MPIITIDGKQIEVEKGVNVIQAAQQVGIEIPHYCYHPGLSIDGNCRMCLVEVKGPRGFMPQIACNTPCTDGLEVKTDTEQVSNMRKGVMEFLLHNHPIDCPICDQAGECRLQDYYMKYGKYDNRSIVEKVHKNKVVDIGDTVVLDQERCVLCSRCVRFCNEVSKTDELAITQRGVYSKVEVFPNTKLDNKYSGNVVDVCPVGALTSKDFRFKMRVWFMSTAKSVCQGCSRGCNIFADYKVPEVYRFRPRANKEVNSYWMCDEGRFSYKQISENRLLEAFEKGEQIEYEQVAQKLKTLIKNTKAKHTAQSIVAIASPRSTVEDNWALKKLMNDVVGTDNVFGASFESAGFEDELLIRADKTPNKKGLEYLGIDLSQFNLVQALSSDKVKLVIIMNNDVIGEGGEKIENLLKDKEVVVLSPYNTETAKKATLAIPVSLYSEKYGSIVNFQGQLQKFERAFDTFDLEDSLATPEYEFLLKLINDNKNHMEIDDIWSKISAEIANFSKISFYDIPDTGINIPKKLEKEAEEARKLAEEAAAAEAAKEVVETPPQA